MNTIGTMFGYLYRHTERERFKINTYGFRYWNDMCFPIDMSKGNDISISWQITIHQENKSHDIHSFAVIHYRFIEVLHGGIQQLLLMLQLFSL